MSWHSVFWSPTKHRWLVRVGAAGRAQRQLTVPADVAPGPRSRKQAEQWAAEQLGEKPPHVTVAPAKPPTLAALAPIVIDLWRQDERLAAKTRADRISFVERHILPAFSALTIEEVDVPRVRAWVRTMRLRGDARPSIGNRLSALSALLSDLHAEGHGPDNRVATSRAVRDELPAIKKRAPAALDLTAFSVLIWADTVPWWFRVLCALAGLAGLEAGAALGLRVKDVEHKEGRPVALRVCQAVQQLGAAGYASVGPTKNEHRGTNERPRVIPVHPALAALLLEWLDIERERWCCRVARPDDLLVPSETGKPWRPKVADRLRRELVGLGVTVPDGLVFHRLRGCFLTWLAAAGVAKDQRQRLAGHAGDVEAEHYEVAGQLVEADREAVSRIPVEVSGGRKREGRVELGSEGDCAAFCEALGEQRRAERGTSRNDAGLCAGRDDSRVRGPACGQRGNATLSAVPFAVPRDDSAAQQVLENASSEGAPGKNRTCDQRFRNSRALCIAPHTEADSTADTDTQRRMSSGAAPSSGSESESAVPFAVREARDGLRWMLLSWDAAEAMLAGLEAER